MPPRLLQRQVMSCWILSLRGDYPTDFILSGFIGMCREKTEGRELLLSFMHK